MTYLGKKPTKEQELAVYWRLMHECWDRFATDPLDPEIDDLIDDIELLREYTEWPMLRALCTRALVLDMQLRHPLVLAAMASERREAL